MSIVQYLHHDERYKIIKGNIELAFSTSEVIWGEKS